MAEAEIESFCASQNVSYEHRVQDYGSFNWCPVPDGGPDAILFAGIAVAAACLASPRWSALILLFAGAAFEALTYYVDLKQASNGVVLWLGLRPADIFIYVFLPPLLLDSAVRIDFFLLRKVSVNVLFMAFIMVALNTLLLIPILLYAPGLRLQNQGWDTNYAALFGTMIASTDAASVVAILKSGGAPEILSVILEGEALFNDASSLTMFTIFQALVQGSKSQTLGSEIGDIIVETLKISFIGIGMGLGCGMLVWLTLRWLQHRNLPPAIEVTVSVVMAYLSYYVTQEIVGGSGVIATVVMGLYGSATLNWGMSNKAVQDNSYAQFWDVLIFILNGIIFFYTGTAACNFTIRSAYTFNLSEQDSTVSIVHSINSLFGNMFSKLPLIYLISFTMRGVLSYLSFNFLSIIKLGHSLNVRETIFITVAGLRGALSLILVSTVVTMTVDHETELEKLRGEAVRTEIGLWVTFYVVFTLIINAPLLGPLLVILKLTTVSPEQMHVRRQLKSTFAHFTDSTLLEMQRDDDELLQGVDWKAVAHTTDHMEALNKVLPDVTRSFDLLALVRMLFNSDPVLDHPDECFHDHADDEDSSAPDGSGTHCGLTQINSSSDAQGAGPSLTTWGRIRAALGLGPLRRRRSLSTTHLTAPRKASAGGGGSMAEFGTPRAAAATSSSPMNAGKLRLIVQADGTADVESPHHVAGTGGQDSSATPAVAFGAAADGSGSDTHHLEVTACSAYPAAVAAAAAAAGLSTSSFVKLEEAPEGAGPLSSSGPATAAASAPAGVQLAGPRLQAVTADMLQSMEALAQEQDQALERFYGADALGPGEEQFTFGQQRPDEPSLRRPSLEPSQRPSAGGTRRADSPLQAALLPHVSGAATSHAAVETALLTVPAAEAGAAAVSLLVGPSPAALGTLSPQLVPSPSLGRAPTLSRSRAVQRMASHHLAKGVLCISLARSPAEPNELDLTGVPVRHASSGEEHISEAAVLMDLQPHTAQDNISAVLEGRAQKPVLSVGLPDAHVHSPQLELTRQLGGGQRLYKKVLQNTPGGLSALRAISTDLPNAMHRARTSDLTSSGNDRGADAGSEGPGSPAMRQKTRELLPNESSHASSQLWAAANNHLPDMVQVRDVEQILPEYRLRLQSGLKQVFRSKYAEGVVCGSSFRILDFICSMGLHHANHPLALWHLAEAEVSSNLYLMAAARAHHVMWVHMNRARHSSHWLVRLWAKCVEVPVWSVTWYLNTMMTTGLEVALELWLVLANSPQVHWLEYGGPAGTQLLEEVEANAQAVWAFIMDRRIEAPERFQAIQTYRATVTLLHKQAAFVREMLEGGMIDDQEADHLLEVINKRQQRFKRGGASWTNPTLSQILRSTVFLRNQPPEIETWLRSHATFKVYKKGDIVWRRDNADGQSPGIFIVISGLVRCEAPVLEGEDDTCFYIGAAGVGGMLAAFVQHDLQGLGMQVVYAEGNALGKGAVVMHLPPQLVDTVRSLAHDHSLPAFKSLHQAMARNVAAYVLDLMKHAVMAQLVQQLSLMMFSVLLDHEGGAAAQESAERRVLAAKALLQVDSPATMKCLNQLVQLPQRDLVLLLEGLGTAHSSLQESTLKALTMRATSVMEAMKGAVPMASLVMLQPNQVYHQSATMVIVQGAVRPATTSATASRAERGTEGTRADAASSSSGSGPPHASSASAHPHGHSQAPSVLMWTPQHFEVAGATPPPALFVADTDGATLLVLGLVEEALRSPGLLKLPDPGDLSGVSGAGLPATVLPAVGRGAGKGLGGAMFGGAHWPVFGAKLRA